MFSASTLRCSRRLRGVTPLATAALLAVALTPVAAAPSQALTPIQISEISYAGDDASDFVEISGEPGADLSGYVVGSVARGGNLQDGKHLQTLSEGTTIPSSGYYAVKVPITNSVDAGSGADGKYGAAVFVADPSGQRTDFEQIGGTAGGRGITAGTSPSLPAGIRGVPADPTGATSPTGQSIQRIDGTWKAAAPTPGVANSTSAPATPEPSSSSSSTSAAPPSTSHGTPIADIQGTTDLSPAAGQTKTTSGVVTAAYPDGGLKGYFIQTPGTGGDQDPTPGRSDGLFVYSPATVGQVAVGDYIEVTGTVSEYHGQTQMTVDSGNEHELADQVEPVQPVTGAFPEDPAAREALEGMLLQPSGPITVTDNYNTNRYGEVGLTNGSTALPQSTDVAAPGEDAKAIEAQNASKEYLLDDGGTVDYTRGANGTPVPYLSTTDPLRVGGSATFNKPVVLGYGFDAWRLQPTTWLTDNKASDSPVTFANNRTPAPEKVGGDVSIASFNVLNYFPTTGDQLTGCTYYEDRAGNPVTVSGGCDARGAANADNFQRQQQKIVDAINSLDTSVLSLEEIENSARFGKNRDEALHHLVDELNKAAGTNKWKAVDSPAQLPGSEDVIRTAFIYQPAKVKPVGDSTILLDDPAFDNARRPLAQAFQPTAEGSQKFLAIVNHFKSKGSGAGAGNADTGDGQGASNGSRKEQAQSLSTFAAAQEEKAGTQNVVLLGDFNSYTHEDPMQILYKAGYRDIGSTKTNKHTYLFGGRVGSIDHVLASGPMFSKVSGADVWNINSVESVGLEYSRYNNNVTNLYSDDPYRSSDHDPLLVGFDTRAATGSGHSDSSNPTSGQGQPGSGNAQPGNVQPGTGDDQPAGGASTQPDQPQGGNGSSDETSHSAGTAPSTGTGHSPAQNDAGQNPGVTVPEDSNGPADDGISSATPWTSTGTNDGFYDGTMASGSQPTGDLASTGATVLPYVIIGLLLLLGGAIAVVLGRRRRTEQS